MLDFSAMKTTGGRMSSSTRGAWPVGRSRVAAAAASAAPAASSSRGAPRRRGRVARASPRRDSSPGSPDTEAADQPQQQQKQWPLAPWTAASEGAPPRSWLSSAPRIRVRGPQQRAASEILELAAVNERLAGELEPWEVRRRLEHLKARVEDWEAVYSYVTQRDAAATLAVVEEAAAAADALLGARAAAASAASAASLGEADNNNNNNNNNSPATTAADANADSASSSPSGDKTGVAELRAQLLQLRAQVDDAASRLSATQERVDENLRRVGELRAEAARLEALRAADARAEADVAVRRAELTSGAASASSSSPASASADPAAVARSAAAAAAAPARGGARGLASSLDLERGLRNFWYAAAFSSRLDSSTLIPFELFGEPWVLFRGEDGRASCLRDECAHRACPLSLGKVENGAVSCAYHGWRFAGDGACVEMPSTAFCRGVRVRSLPVVEANGFVWVWPGDKAAPVPGDGAPEWQTVAAAALPPSTDPSRPYLIHAEIELEVPVEHGLLMENLLDLAHAPFTHTSTFAKGWPVPSVVRFHAERALSGAWDPYPIDMAFHPPCVAVSVIGLSQPGKIQRGQRAGECERHLYQMHVCLPAKKGHTRLLYRMALDFMPWARGLPFVDSLWKRVAGQVLGEDLVLVQGQQARMQQGGDTWQNPVSYDKLAVRYRRWRNAAAAAGATAAGAAGVAPGSRRAAARLSAPVTMSAGDLFLTDVEEEEEVVGGVMVEAREQGEGGGADPSASAAARAAADDEGVYVDSMAAAEMRR